LADKHTIIIVVLLILFVGSLGYSFLSGGSDAELQDLSNKILELEKEKERLVNEKTSLVEGKTKLQNELAQAKEIQGSLKQIPQDDRNIYEVEKDSPFDHVKNSQINVLKNKVEINMADVAWWEIADTNSMDPLIDIGSVALTIKPKSTNDVHLGDVGLYNSNIAKTVIIHRVIRIDSDDKGWYSRFRGDNLKKVDPEKVRFEMMEGIMIGVIY
jgi:hypothetical protein